MRLPNATFVCSFVCSFSNSKRISLQLFPGSFNGNFSAENVALWKQFEVKKFEKKPWKLNCFIFLYVYCSVFSCSKTVKLVLEIFCWKNFRTSRFYFGLNYFVSRANYIMLILIKGLYYFGSYLFHYHLTNPKYCLSGQ